MAVILLLRVGRRRWSETRVLAFTDGERRETTRMGRRDRAARGLFAVLLIVITRSIASVSSFFLSIGPNRLPTGDSDDGGVQPWVYHRADTGLPRPDDVGSLEVAVPIFWIGPVKEYRACIRRDRMGPVHRFVRSMRLRRRKGHAKKAIPSVARGPSATRPLPDMPAVRPVAALARGQE